MQDGSALPTSSTPTAGCDLVFTCEHCAIPLVVDRAAAGITLTCQRCGRPTAVPLVNRTRGDEAASPKESGEKLAELQRRLTENESQRTEITGYINQLSIKLHRWQLRLQVLKDRQKELMDEISAVREAGSVNAS